MNLKQTSIEENQNRQQSARLGGCFWVVSQESLVFTLRRTLNVLINNKNSGNNNKV